jgi:aminomethyltransferase
LGVTPNQAGLGWAVGWKKDAFWGRAPLMVEKDAGPRRKLRGLVALERGIPRPGMIVSLTPDVPLCEITSGTYSPTLKKGIGMALVPAFVDPDAQLGVQIRTRREIFESHRFPFVDTSVRET